MQNISKFVKSRVLGHRGRPVPVNIRLWYVGIHENSIEIEINLLGHVVKCSALIVDLALLSEIKNCVHSSKMPTAGIIVTYSRGGSRVRFNKTIEKIFWCKFLEESIRLKPESVPPRSKNIFFLMRPNEITMTKKALGIV